MEWQKWVTVDRNALNNGDNLKELLFDLFLVAVITTVLEKHHGNSTCFGARQVWIQIPASHLNPDDTAQPLKSSELQFPLLRQMLYT